MASAYPGGLDALPDAPDGSAKLGLTTPKHTEHHQGLTDAVKAVQQTLGLNPQGDFTDVAARLAAGIDGGPILVSAPSNTVAPAVTGSTTLGATLTCSTGTWSGEPTSYAYQWQRNGVDIAGEIANTYVIAAEDDGTTLRCVVTATNDFGSTDANSNGVAISFAPAYTPSLDFSDALNSMYVAAIAA